MDKILVTVVSYMCYGVGKVAIDSIIKNTDEPFDLLLINNAPGDSLTSNYFNKLKAEHDNIYIINNPSNIGIAASWNKALDFMFKNPDYKWISLFHTDVVLNRGWASKIKRAFKEHPEYDGFSPIEINTTETEYLTLPILTKNRILYNAFNMAFLHSDEAVLHEVNMMYDGNFEDKATEFEDQLKDLIVQGGGFSAVTIKREVFEKVGYFDECFMCGGEDTDFYERMKAIGLKTAKTGYAFSHHWCSVTFINSKYIDGKQEANKARDIFTAKMAKGTVKNCLKETCRHNNGGICAKGYSHFFPTLPCPEYDSKI